MANEFLMQAMRSVCSIPLYRMHPIRQNINANQQQKKNERYDAKTNIIHLNPFACYLPLNSELALNDKRIEVKAVLRFFAHVVGVVVIFFFLIFQQTYLLLHSGTNK